MRECPHHQAHVVVRSQLRGVSGLFYFGSGTKLDSPGLHSKHFYPLSHLDNPNLVFSKYLLYKRVVFLALRNVAVRCSLSLGVCSLFRRAKTVTEDHGVEFEVCHSRGKVAQINCLVCRVWEGNIIQK